MQIICFEDSLVQRLAPITLARPAYAITCGGHRLIDWLRRCRRDGDELSAFCRDYLQVIQSLDWDMQIPGDLQDDVVLVNSRVVPSVDLAGVLTQLIGRTAAGVLSDPDDGSLLLARLTGREIAVVKQRPPTTKLLDSLIDVAGGQPPLRFDAAVEAFRWPHDVVAKHMQHVARSTQWFVDHGDYQQLQDGLFVRPGVKIGDYASIHTGNGVIVLEDDVKIGPFCFLEGPLLAGAGTRVLEHAAIKDGVSLGHTVKIGGEVEASVIEPYTNKQHHGFLGHSYLGSWINLGAGTCNSDLKNTYGKINIQYGSHKIATGMQFLGCIMGDYSKSAINTGIFTGKVIGVCSMMYGFVTSNVPSYVNYARLFGQTSLLPADVMVNTQKRMFARRKVEQRDCDRQLIVDMYDRTQSEREMEQIGF